MIEELLNKLEGYDALSAEYEQGLTELQKYVGVMNAEQLGRIKSLIDKYLKLLNESFYDTKSR